MRLHVKQPNGEQTDFRFARGPIYLGRHSQCEVLLPELKVSRQHAVIYLIPEGDAIIQDLGSANGTYINDQPISKHPLTSGDSLRIGDFVITVDLDDHPHRNRPQHPDDTLVGVDHQPQIIQRQLNAEQAPDITLPAFRARNFAEACKLICQANGHQQTLDAILGILSRQFDPAHAWCALREDSDGPMTCEAGQDRDGKPLQLQDLELKAPIVKAVQNQQFLLLPQNARSAPAPHLRSAMIAPLLDTEGCVGVLYVDNRNGDEHYSLQDLDYLVLLALHIAAVFENF